MILCTNRKTVPRLPWGLLLATLVVSTGIAVDGAAQGTHPTLRVTVNSLPEFVFTNESPAVSMTWPAGQPITLRWEATAGEPSATITGYRFGWNIRNPSNDQEWEQDWCSTCSRTTTRTFNAGVNRFF